MVCCCYIVLPYIVWCVVVDQWLAVYGMVMHIMCVCYVEVCVDICVVVLGMVVCLCYVVV